MGTTHLMQNVLFQADSMVQWKMKRYAVSSANMIWRERTNHSTDCYFCLTKVSGHSKRTKSGIVYPDCRSALRPVTHTSENIPITTPPQFQNKKMKAVQQNHWHHKVLRAFQLRLMKNHIHHEYLMSRSF